MNELRPLVPADFAVPAMLEHPRFRLRMLTVHDLIKDFEAVMVSVTHLQETYSALWGSDWPAGLTLEEDLIDLGWHQREFTLRTSFAYTMMAPDESRCLGCLYINPTRKAGHDASITMWVRADELASGLDGVLEAEVRRWIAEVWPFTNPAFPGRSVSIEGWRAMPEVS